MKIGVIIRSIGERTEKLCYESVSQCIPDVNIHIVRDYFPSYKAYIKMFEIAKSRNYDWFLGIDADVVLRNDWLYIFEKQLLAKKHDDIFRYHFMIKDYITRAELSRGNHFYNGKYIDLALKYLKYNVRIGRFWFFYKLFGYNKKLFLKPESEIQVHMLKHNLIETSSEEIIGWHGYEQYYSEIFRQYLVRYHRDPGFINSFGKDFLPLERQKELLSSEDFDRYIANIAWNNANRWKLESIDGRIKNEIISFMESIGISEKSPNELSIDDFYTLYNN